MELDPTTYEKIEAYLLGTLSDSEKTAFEKEVKSDSNLEEEVLLHKEMIVGLEDAAIKEDLKVIHKELDDQFAGIPKSKRRYYVIVAAILIFIFSYLAYLIFWPSPEKNDPQSNPTTSDTLSSAVVAPQSVVASESVASTPVKPEARQESVTLSVSDPRPADPASTPTVEAPVAEPVDTLTLDSEPEAATQPVAPDQGTDLAPDMVLISGGNFRMGSPSGARHEMPLRTVRVDDFYMDRHEVTNQAFCGFLNDQNTAEVGSMLTKWADIKDNGITRISFRGGEYKPMSGLGQYPVVGVTWLGASAYAAWAGKRLPTEAEWEFAARGGNRTQGYAYAGSRQPAQISWNDANSKGHPHPVGLKKPNEMGLHDMSGNVWEWVADRYDLYPSEDEINPQGPDYGSERVIRGGSYEDYDALRVASRSRYAPNLGKGNIGFRCVK